MISKDSVKRYCRDDIQKIENYNEAVSDMVNMWECHHRLELTLDGQPACCRDDLIRHGMYYKRPAFELIFVKPQEHALMHADIQKTKTKGKQDIPYLLSTTKTLVRCQRYYYRYFDFHFNCRRNREYFSVENARVNMTRQWHNVIIPNAILSRESGKPATWADAIGALAYAMTSGKLTSAVLAWDALLKEEAALPTDQRVWRKYYKSFLYYGLGQAINKDGFVYQLPKAKMVSLTAYYQRNWKLMSSKNPIDCWESPWNSLNRMVNEFRKDKNIRRLTQRELVTRFNISMTSATMFRRWVRQWIKYFVLDSDYLVEDAPVNWVEVDEPEPKEDNDILEDAIETSATEHFEQLCFESDFECNKVINSGSRPIAKEPVEYDLPF